jgi:hypothetical protein
MDDTEDIGKFKQRLLEEMLGLSLHPNDVVNEQHRKGFTELGFIEDGKFGVPIVHEADQTNLAEIAGLITDDLIRLLEKHRGKLLKSYQASSYRDEVSFEEYAIWWYHFFYTGVTDILVEKGNITKPTTGVFTYITSP